MEKDKAKLLFEAIKNDDVKSFCSVVSSNADLKVRFGRFPLLSVCYLYSSYKILNKFENAMLSCGNFTELIEPFEIYSKFKKSAKKVLKLYVLEDKIIYPIEMLAVLNQRELLVHNFSKLYKNDDIIKNLKSIFAINYNLTIEVSNTEILLKRERLNLKQKIVALIVASVFIVMSLFSAMSILIVKFTSGLGTENNPILVSSEAEFLTAINGGKLHYKLTDDIFIKDYFVPSDFSGVIDGNGHTINLENNKSVSLTNTLSGTIKNLKLNILAKYIDINKSVGIFANSVTGKIEGCEIYGDISAEFVLDNAEETDNTYFSIFACSLIGMVVNCKSNVSVDAKNNSGKNAFVSLVGENSGLIENCENLGAKFEADTVDLAGIVVTNLGSVVGAKNYAEIYQTSNNEWHPNCAGIAITNEGMINTSENHAKISAISTLKEFSSSSSGTLFTYSSGIVVDNIGTIYGCNNTGKIFAETEIAVVYAAGIVCRNLVSQNNVGKVNSCEAKCDIESLSTKEAYVAGVATVNTGMLDNSGFFGQLSSSNNYLSFGAGVCSNNRYGVIQNCYSGATFNSDENAVNTYYASFAIFNWEFLSGNLNNYFANNKYLKIDKYPICYSFFSNYYNEIRNDSECGCKGYYSVDELESEVKND